MLGDVRKYKVWLFIFVSRLSLNPNNFTWMMLSYSFDSVVNNFILIYTNRVIKICYIVSVLT